MIISVLVWRKSIHFEDMRENDFYIFVPTLCLKKRPNFETV